MVVATDKERMTKDIHSVGLLVHDSLKAPTMKLANKGRKGL
jgi:hypothetical protein